jgi:hypothetical protein
MSTRMSTHGHLSFGLERPGAIPTAFKMQFAPLSRACVDIVVDISGDNTG